MMLDHFGETYQAYSLRAGRIVPNFSTICECCDELAQWLVLRRQVAHAMLWVPITIAGWLALGAIIGKSIDTGTDLVMFGLLPALITGAGLLWLLRHSHAD